MPNSGLLSIFAFEEFEEYGTVWTRLFYFPETDDLERRDHPSRNPVAEANQIRHVERLAFFETLELPEHYDSPWTDDLALGEDDDASERYHEMKDVCHASIVEGILGYTQATSGGDPTSDRHSRKLLCLESVVGSMLHFTIANDDLAAGRLEEVELAWVDFD